MALKLFKRKKEKESGIDNLVFNRSHSIPKVDFNRNGILELCGRLIPEDSFAFFEGLINWVKELKVEKVVFNVKLEYINTTSTQNLLLLFKEIENNNYIQEIYIDWYYESDDPESKDLGMVISSNLNKSKFRFIDCEDIDEV